jgi:hypothetical protein
MTLVNKEPVSMIVMTNSHHLVCPGKNETSWTWSLVTTSIHTQHSQ